MSNITDKFFNDKTKGALWDVAVSIKRNNPLPLDRDSVIHNLSELEELKNSPVTYPGQLVSVISDAIVENEEIKSPETTSLYYFDHNLNYHKIGNFLTGDNRSIEIKDEESIKLFGFENAISGMLPIVGTAGKIEWKTIEKIQKDTNTTYNFAPIKKETGENYGIQIQPKENNENLGEPIQISFNVFTESEVTGLLSKLEEKIDNFTDTTYSIKENEKVLKLDNTEFSTVIALKYISANENQPAKIQLLGIDNVVISEIDATPFIKDGMLEDVEYDAKTNTLIFTWNTEAGTKTDAVFLSDIIEPYTSGKGLSLKDNKFEIKIDEKSEKYLEVNDSGLKITGINQALLGIQGDTSETVASVLLNLNNYKEENNNKVQLNTSSILELKNNLEEKADSKSVYTKEEIGTISENKTLVQIISESDTNILTQAKENTKEQIEKIPIAENVLGLVKGIEEDDKIKVEPDGTMSLTRISTNKLYVPEGSELILNGG